MKLSELAEQIGAELRGSGAETVEAVASLQEAGAGDVSFLSEPRYAGQLSQTKAAAVIVPEAMGEQPTGLNLLLVKDVDEALEQTLTIFAPPADLPAVGVDPSASVAVTARLANSVAVGPNAVISEAATIGEATIVGAGCFVGRKVLIGDHCWLGPNVVIQQDCVLGNNVRIDANSTIGSDGFGYRLAEGRHRKVPHIGIVVIEDDVEIGANSCVDRAKFGRTVVGRGTKIDNLVQIAHNVQLGENCIVVAQTGIAGSSELGKYVVLAGQVGIGDHVRIGNGAQIGAQSGVLRNVADGAQLIGMPPRTIRSWHREQTLIHRLPEMDKEIKRLRKQLDDRASTTDDK